MGAFWLRDLETVIRPGCPFPVLTVPGWETRSRSTGGYDSVNGIVVHHDAAGPSSDGWPSVNYQCFSDPDRPNAALYTSRKGEVFIMAAGACNTQGKGGPMLGVPQDQGNQRLIGIEQGNNGVGETYTTAQQNAIEWLIERLLATYGKRFGWGAGNVISHHEWAPTRKCDPGGPSRWTGGVPGCGAAFLWDMDRFRGSVSTGSTEEGGFILTPEDKAYLDGKFNDLWITIANDHRGIMRAPEQAAIIQGDVRAVVQEPATAALLTKIVTDAVKAVSGQVDPNVLKAAIVAAMAGVTFPASLDAATEQAIAVAVNDEMHRRSES